MSQLGRYAIGVAIVAALAAAAGVWRQDTSSAEVAAPSAAPTLDEGFQKGTDEAIERLNRSTGK